MMPILVVDDGKNRETDENIYAGAHINDRSGDDDSDGIGDNSVQDDTEDDYNSRVIMTMMIVIIIVMMI